MLRDTIRLENLTYKTSGISEKREGYNVLGILEGQHFVPDGFSRNKRYYDRYLWLKQLKENSEVERMIKDRSMFGTIGHDMDVSEKELREGLVSHITTDLQLEKNGIAGYGRSEILDTPAGRALHCYLKAGVNLYVSSRADGSFKNETVYNKEFDLDVPVLDPETFQLERFDIVLKPGFLQANPKLAESFDTKTIKVIESLEIKEDLETQIKVLEEETLDKEDQYIKDIEYTDKNYDIENSGDNQMTSSKPLEQLNSVLAENENLKKKLN